LALINAAISSVPFELEDKELEQVKEYVPNIDSIYSQFKSMPSAYKKLNFLYAIFNGLCQPEMASELLYPLKSKIIAEYSLILNSGKPDADFYSIDFDIGHLLFCISIIEENFTFLISRNTPLGNCYDVELTILPFLKGRYRSQDFPKGVIYFPGIAFLKLIEKTEKWYSLKLKEMETIPALTKNEIIHLSDKFPTFPGLHNRLENSQSLEILYDIFSEISEWKNSSPDCQKSSFLTSFKFKVIFKVKEFLKIKEKSQSFLASVIDLRQLIFHNLVMASNDKSVLDKLLDEWTDVKKFQTKEIAARLREFLVKTIENEIRVKGFDKTFINSIVSLLDHLDSESEHWKSF
jgi:hypothetical protein